MLPTYSISIDPHRYLLRLSLSGFFDRPTLTRFVADRNAAVVRLGCRPKSHVTLCDLTACKLSTPEIVEDFRQMVGDPRYASRRLAFVVEASLARMQLRRVVQRDDVAYFTDVADAERWLSAA